MWEIWDACARWDDDYNLPLERRRQEMERRREESERPTLGTRRG